MMGLEQHEVNERDFVQEFCKRFTDAADQKIVKIIESTAREDDIVFGARTVKMSKHERLFSLSEKLSEFAQQRDWNAIAELRTFHYDKPKRVFKFTAYAEHVTLDVEHTRRYHTMPVSQLHAIERDVPDNIFITDPAAFEQLFCCRHFEQRSINVKLILDTRFP